MKDKEKRVRQADLLRGILGVLIILFAMVAQAKPGPLLLLLALVVFMGFLAVECFMNRCPHCDRYLGRNFGFFCQHCGERIREEKTDT